MRTALRTCVMVGTVLALATPMAMAEDVQPERGVFVEVVPARGWCYPGELLRVKLRIEILFESGFRK